MADRIDLTRGHLPNFGVHFSIPPLQLRSTSVSAPAAFHSFLPFLLQEASDSSSEGPSILTRPSAARPPDIDPADIVLWITEAAALGVGLGLVVGMQDRPSQAIGAGLITYAGEGLLLELVDRLIHGHHENRWLCLGLSLGAGLLAGLFVGFAARLDRSGIVSAPADPRNPTTGWGP